MMDSYFPQTVLLLGTAVAIVVAFQRLRIPSSLAYLLVGILLGPHTSGPVLDAGPIQALAEFGIVFLLFTIGLNFSLPQLHALRHLVLGLGTGQVLLTTLAVALPAWLMGLPAAAAFVVGAVFAQSSTTMISRQLVEQGEEHSRHGRLAIAMSVFQDVTAVPLVVVVPVLGAATAGAATLATALGLAFVKAAVAFLLVLIVGTRILRPLFHIVAGRRSAELFTLTVLFVSLIAAWTTHSLGLSMAFGAFLAGMMLGETEFRHQVEATIRPFRDVLLGLFFVGIGMLFDPWLLPGIWLHAVAGAAALIGIKAVLVAQTARLSGIDARTAWRTGWLLAIGGEFGFAVLAIALDAGTIAQNTGQVVLTAVLLSMAAGPLFIRYNDVLARWCAYRAAPPEDTVLPQTKAAPSGALKDHVIVCGFGRIGQSVARLLEKEGIPYIALDLDSTRARAAHAAGEPVFYGDAAERDILEAVGVGSARLVVISHEDVAAAQKTLHHLRAARPTLPVMVRTRDESHVEELRKAGATEVVPETREASLMIAAHALLLLKVPGPVVMRRIEEQIGDHYSLLRELFRGDIDLDERPPQRDADRLRPVVVASGSPLVGQTLATLALDGILITALVRGGERQLAPPPATALQANDVLVLFGSRDDLERAADTLLG